jgi:putative transposase
MKEWLTAREIAEEKLRDMPATESAIIRMAKTNNWAEYTGSARYREGRGGGIEYHIRLLPALAQFEYARKHLRISKPDAPEVMAAQDDGSLSAKARQERDARLAIVHAFNKYHTYAMRKGGRIGQFCFEYEHGKLAVDLWVREVVPTLSRRSLGRWVQDHKNGKALGFDRAEARKGKGALNTANGGLVQQFILGLIAHQPHLSAAHVRSLCRSEFGDHIKAILKGVEQSIAMPPVRTFQAAIAELKASHKVELVKLTNPDLYRSSYAPSGVGMLRHITEPNALWQIDASPVDALCTDGRHAVYACIDIATRRVVLSLSRTPRASAVALLIRKAMLAWGVPDTIKTDNGSDFVAKDTKRLFAAINIEMDLSQAYTPQEKGHVERAIKTFQHDFGTLLPGFIGHNVSDRKAIESRKSFTDRLSCSDEDTFAVTMTGLQLASYMDDWCARLYNVREHGGLKGALKGKTPDLAAAQSTRTQRFVNERALDVLLMPVAGKDGIRTVTKFGIRIDHYHYMTPHILPGEVVLVRQDPMDMGKAYVFASDGGAYLGVATCPELSGINPQAFVKEAKAMQAEKIADATRQIKADMKKIASGPALIERVLDVARRDAPNVVMLQKWREEHTTEQISAALAAMKDAAQPSSITAFEDKDARQRRLDNEAAFEAREKSQISETLARFVNEFEDRVAETRVAGLAGNVVRIPETPKERFKRSVDIRAAMEAGKEELFAGAIIWMTRYEMTTEFKGEMEMLKAYGDAYFS